MSHVELYVPEAIDVKRMRDQHTILESGSWQLERDQPRGIKRFTRLGKRRASGKLGRHWSENVPAVKSCRYRLEPEARAGDVESLHHAPSALGCPPEQSVIGTDQDPLVRQQQRYSPPLGSDTRIDNGQMNSNREVRKGGAEEQRACADVVAPDAMSEVDHARLRALHSYDRVANANEFVGQPIVREERDRRLVDRVSLVSSR